MDEKFAKPLIDQFGEKEAEALLVALEQEPTHCLILNTKKISVSDFLSLFPKVEPHPFIDSAFYYRKEDYDFGKSILHAAGAIYIQDAAAMMVSYLLKINPGDTCIDLCAAPGGKTIDTCLLFEPSILVSNDLSSPRARELSGNIERLGIDNAIVANAEVSALAEFYGSQFDKVILDAPCSGSAMFRKNALAKDDWTKEKVLRCADIQRSLLPHAKDLLKPGGELIYSTCSFSVEENEEQVRAFLESNPDMEIIDLPQSDLFVRAKSLPEAIYLLPSRYKGEGQFICKMRKSSSAESASSRFKKEKSAKKCSNCRDLEKILKDYGLFDRFVYEHGKAYYALIKEFAFDPRWAIRPGLKLCVDEKPSVPDYALSHALSSTISIPLSLQEAKLYLHGDTFPIKSPDGFHVVSYNGVNLGFVKVVSGIAKNHYPKGLRLDYSKIDY